MVQPKWDFRDVSGIVKAWRTFLLGRDHVLHPRFPPCVSPRTIPLPDIPRGPEYKYSKNYYYGRNARDSVKVPIGSTFGPEFPPDKITFFCAPTPGRPWWWDGHNYYENPWSCPPPEFPPCPPDCECPPCPTQNPC